MSLKLGLIFILFFMIFVGIFWGIQNSNLLHSDKVSLFLKNSSTQISFSVNDINSKKTEIFLTEKFISPDKALSFNYPKGWDIQQNQTSEPEQNWILTNNQNSIDFKIIQNEDEITTEESIDCPDKATFCDEVEINNHHYKKFIATLNTGMILIQLGRAKEDKILSIQASIRPHDHQSENLKLIEEIFNTLDF